MGRAADELLNVVRPRLSGWTRPEVVLYGCVADLVQVHADTFVAYELKSERDVLDRLVQQVSAYSTCADKVVVICASKHLSGAARLLKDYSHVGLECDDGDVIKPASPSPWVVANALEQTLWNRELEAWLEELGAARGVRGKGRRQLLRRLDAAGVGLQDLRKRVRDVLPVRDWEFYTRRGPRGC